jgi:hypothetical protein
MELVEQRERKEKQELTGLLVQPGILAQPDRKEKQVELLALPEHLVLAELQDYQVLQAI